MACGFKVIDITQYPLWDFGWFDVTQFGIQCPPAEGLDVRSILTEFLLSPMSQRRFCDQSPWGEPAGHRGPFRHGCLTPYHYRPISRLELADRLTAALDDPEFTTPPSPDQRRPVEAWAEAISSRGDSLFALEAPPSPECRLDWDVWSIYCEFIAVSSDGRELTFGALGYD